MHSNCRVYFSGLPIYILFELNGLSSPVLALEEKDRKNIDILTKLVK